MKEEIHSTKQRRQFTSLNERESLTELRVICAIAGEWGATDRLPCGTVSPLLFYIYIYIYMMYVVVYAMK